MMFLDSNEQKQHRLWRRQAAAVKQLGPCSVDKYDIVVADKQGTCTKWSRKRRVASAWDFQTVRLSSRQATVDASHNQGRLGQAVLSLPGLAGTDVHIALPPALSLTATQSGGLDCRLQLFGLTAEWPAVKQPRSKSQQQTPQLQPARSAAAGFAVRCGGLLLAHALFPDHTNNVLACLALPVALADGVAAVAAAVPAPARQAVKQRAGRLKHKLQGTSDSSYDGGCADASVGWIDVSAGLLAGSMHAVRSMSGPAAAVAAGGWLWSVLHPSTHTLCSCLVALMAVSADYQQLGKEIAAGKHGTDRSVEGLWHARHKAAAQRLAPFCGDLPYTPPLQPLMKLASRCSIAAGIAVDGQQLAGAVGGELARGSDWASAGAPLLQSQPQLLLSVSYQPPQDSRVASKAHSSAGLSRSQLLELFTGSADSSEDSASTTAECPSLLHPSEAQQHPAAPVQQGHQLVSNHLVADVQGVSSSLPLQSLMQQQERNKLDKPGKDDEEAVVDDHELVVVFCPSDGTFTPRSEHEDAGSSTAAAVDASASVASAAPAFTESLAPIVTAVAVGSANAGGSSMTCFSRSSSTLTSTDPLAFLDHMPLYGQQDHAGSLAAAAAAQQVSVRERMQLCLRGVYLLLVFSPFLLLGAPMLLLAAYLTNRAQQQQCRDSIQQLEARSTARQRQLLEDDSTGSNISSSVLVEGAGQMTAVSPLFGSPSKQQKLRQTVRHTASAAWYHISHPLGLLQALMQQLLLLLSMLCAVLDVAVVLLLGGRWSAGVDVWLSAGSWLRQRAWELLLQGCRRAGAAFIKWGQWSASRRDIFPADFCDTLAQLHDKAPVHSFRHTQREVEASFGVPLAELFDSFEPKALASGSIAQVHKAKIRNSRVTAALRSAKQQQEQQLGADSSRVGNQAGKIGSRGWFSRANRAIPNSKRAVSSITNTSRDGQAAAAAADNEPVTEVVVKVCHPNVAYQIAQDFKLLSALSAAAARLPVLRGLSIRESVSQFSHTMTAQTDLRVEAVHALRFYNNFKGVQSSVSIPRPIPGLVSPTVLVETFEKGHSVAAYMKESSAINTEIVGLGVDAFLKMLLVDNFVHTDLHPGNILFRAVPNRSGAKQVHKQHVQQQGAMTQTTLQQQQLKQQKKKVSWWKVWSRLRSASSRSMVMTAEGGGDAALAEPEQWELQLQQQIDQQKQLWGNAHGASNKSSSATGTSLKTASGDLDAQLMAELLNSSDSSSPGGPSSPGGASAQLVLLDFGLAEELTPEVRHHFISFLLSISAGDGLAAARHLLSWSHKQTCPDRSAFTADVVTLFEQECNINSDAGIDLDAVMKAVLGLARKHYVSIDSCYASLVISVCVLVGFAQALDPEVNLMDAATPTLLAYAMTGAVVGRLYST